MPRRSPKADAFGGPGRQHDASDFLIYFIDVLHDEMNFKRDLPDYQAQLVIDLVRRHPELVGKTKNDISNFPDDEPTSYLNTQTAIVQEWGRFLDGENSKISTIFRGLDTWITHCPTCGFALKRFSPYTVLQINFPDKYTTRAGYAPLTLMDMIRWQFNADPKNCQKMEGYKCQRCKTKDLCYQDRAISYFSDYLILEFQRFLQVDGGLESAKITAQVKFSETIDLTSAFIRFDEPTPDGIKLYGGQIGPFIYDCYAVVLHHGDTLKQGHYTAIARSLDKSNHASGTWHRFNDTHVEPTNFQVTQADKATVTQVFMKRRPL